MNNGNDMTMGQTFMYICVCLICVVATITMGLVIADLSINQRLIADVEGEASAATTAQLGWGMLTTALGLHAAKYAIE